MSWGYRFRLPDSLCSKVKAVSGHFIVLQNKVINLSKFTVPERELQQDGRSFSVGPRCSLMTFLACLAKVSRLCPDAGSSPFIFLIKMVSGDGEVGRLRGSVGSWAPEMLQSPMHPF